MNNQCEYSDVLRKLNMHATRRCKNKATVVVDGKWYCRVHNPEAMAQREEERKRKAKKRSELKSKLYRKRLIMLSKRTSGNA